MMISVDRNQGPVAVLLSKMTGLSRYIVNRNTKNYRILVDAW